MELWEHPGARVDRLVLYASRAEVEAADIDHALSALNKLLNPEVAQRLKGRLIFEIRGYEDDPRDLWEIPEVRAWMQALDQAFPHWFYFMNVGSRSTLAFIAFSLCTFKKVPNGKIIPPDELQRFLIFHLRTMSVLSKQLGESSSENDRRTVEIGRFFFLKNEPPDKSVP
jgi:hypothetical protein